MPQLQAPVTGVIVSPARLAAHFTELLVSIGVNVGVSRVCRPPSCTARQKVLVARPVGLARRWPKSAMSSGGGAGDCVTNIGSTQDQGPDGLLQVGFLQYQVEK